MDTLFFVIVERGATAKILTLAQRYGITGATVFLGRGTARSRFLTTRLLPQQAKEIVLLRTDKKTAAHLHDEVGKTLRLNKRGTGIACSIPLTTEAAETAENRWQCIITIVERGQSEACMRAARKAGALGGTVISGRGAGVPAHFYVDLAIEPQKDVVVILAHGEVAQRIREQIISDLDLERTGGGMLFCLAVSQSTGLADQEDQG